MDLDEEYRNPVPVLAEEALCASKAVAHDDYTITESHRALTPTGIAPLTIEYVGKVSNKEISTDGVFDSVRLTSHDGGDTVKIQAENHPVFDYDAATALSEGSYFRVKGIIQPHEEDVSHIILDDIAEVSQTTRINYLTNTAEIVLDRVEALIQYETRNDLIENPTLHTSASDPKEIAIQEYDFDKDELAQWGTKALKKAEENTKTL